jgi:hypothetical protein
MEETTSQGFFQSKNNLSRITPTIACKIKLKNDADGENYGFSYMRR